MDIKNEYNVSVVSFKIIDSSGNQIYKLPIKNGKYEENISCECVVFLPDDFINHFSNNEKVYFHLSTYQKISFDRPLLYQESEVLVKDIPANGLIKLNFNLNFPVTIKFTPYKLVGYRFSVSNKDLYHQTDNKKGVFFDTVVTSEVINDD